MKSISDRILETAQSIGKERKNIGSCERKIKELLRQSGDFINFELASRGEMSGDELLDAALIYSADNNPNSREKTLTEMISYYEELKKIKEKLSGFSKRAMFYGENLSFGPGNERKRVYTIGQIYNSSLKIEFGPGQPKIAIKDFSGKGEMMIVPDMKNNRCLYQLKRQDTRELDISGILSMSRKVSSGELSIGKEEVIEEVEDFFERCGENFKEFYQYGAIKSVNIEGFEKEIKYFLEECGII